MPKIRKVVTARYVAEVDSDEWAAEYGLDPADIDSIQSDVGEWLYNATDVVLTEMPGNANTLRITEVERQIVSSVVARAEYEVDQETGDILDENGVAHGNIHEG